MKLAGRGYPDRIGRVYDEIDDHLRGWIGRQSMFFVGTAPASLDGHVNISPKGPIGTLSVLDPHTVAYLDTVGSGAETIAHVRENGRIVVMLCAFEGPPRIVRLHGRGQVLTAAHTEFDALFGVAGFQPPAAPQARRGIVRVRVSRIADSCGYGVPLMRYEGERPHAEASAAKRLRTGGEGTLGAYQLERNATSLDGLPAITPADLQPAPRH